MRRWRALAQAFSVVLLSLACSGGSGHSAPCGEEGEACCAESACTGSLLCRSEVCVACPLDEAGVTWLAFTTNGTGSLDISLVHEDGTCVVPLVTGASDNEFPVFVSRSAMGFSSTRSGGSSVYRADLTTLADSGIPILGVEALAPSFSSDGVWIAFEGRTASATHTDIYRVLSVGGSPEPLTSGSSTSAGPVYSPDGSSIYFVSNRGDGHYRVYSMNADGTSPTAVSGTEGVLGRPAVSPDGSSLAFARLDAGGTAEVLVQDLATDAQAVVSDLGDTDPAFDSTGTLLAVTSTRGGGPAIWVMDAADGKNAVQVTSPSSGTVNGQPAFRP